MADLPATHHLAEPAPPRPEIPPARRPPARRSPLRRLVAAGAGLVAVVVLAGCSTGPGTQEEFVEVLTREGAFGAGEADCIAQAVFDEYGDDDDALGKISAAPDFAYFDTAEGIPGFSEFFDRTVQGCVQVGPTASN